MLGKIYCITNCINEKMYVGQTSTDRRLELYASGNGHGVIGRAIKKHGWENFSLSIIEEIPIELLNEAEMFWIDFLNTMSPNGYNLTAGGDGVRGYQASDEERRQISESLKGHEVPAETRRKISDALKGRTLTAEHRDNISKGNKGHEVSPETRKRIGDAQKGKVISDEQRRQISNALKGRKIPKSVVAKRVRTMRKNRGIIDWIDELEVD